MKFVFLEIILFLANTVTLTVRSSHVSESRRKSEPQNRQGFLTENRSQAGVDCAEGNTWRDKSCVFILLLPESQNPGWNFAVPAIFVPPSCLTQMVLV